jgi:hypothetical protein
MPLPGLSNNWMRLLFLKYAPSSRLAFTFRKTIYPYSLELKQRWIMKGLQ